MLHIIKENVVLRIIIMIITPLWSLVAKVITSDVSVWNRINSINIDLWHFGKIEH